MGIFTSSSTMKIFVIRILTLSVLMTETTAEAENVRFFSLETDQTRGVNFVNEPVTVLVNLQQSFSSIGSHFVGVTIDANEIRHNFSTLDFSSKKIQNMARALTPTYFRLGGTSADAMTYDLGDTSADAMTYDLKQGHHPVSAHKPQQEFNMTAELWRAVNQFSQTVGWDLIMDLNVLKRKADGSWDPENARQLLQFSAKMNYTIAGFELGNEYNLFNQSVKKIVTPEQLAKDVARLQQLLAQFPHYYSSFIIGPETGTMYGKYFLGYYFAGSKGKISYFTDVKRMADLAHNLDITLAQTRSVNPQLPVWLSETSSAYNSGTPNISDKFVAGFLWLDKLGVCALKGLQTVLRQDFYGGNYALVDIELNPNPDFWLTVLYKRIVRGPVFNVTARQDVRVYAACANPDNFEAGSLTVYILNPNNYTVTFHLPQFQSQLYLVYRLTAGDNDGLLSKYMSLNGVKLQLTDDELPDLKPASASPGPLTMAPYSFTFLVYPQAKVSICMGGN